MVKNNRKIYVKIICLLILLVILGNFVVPLKTLAIGINTDINEDEKEDTYLFDTTDSIITTKTGLERTIPETFGKYDRSVYPIPGVQTCTQEMFGDIMAENLEVMTDLETQIENGTLKKHIAADGQYYGTVPDDAKAVEKIVYYNTNMVGAHSLGVFIPAGEIATITIPEEYLSYFQQKNMWIRVGLAESNATDYAKGGKSRMPYLGYTFYATDTEIKVGTPFGGMIYVQENWNVPEGLEIPITVSGAVDTPYYDLGRTTKEEWEISKDAPGLYAEFRTPYQRFMVPSIVVRQIEDPKDILEFWTNVGATSTYAYGSIYRRLPTTMLFDDYIQAGAALAIVGGWACICPTSWAYGALNYNTITQTGGWGTLHEFNHHWQGTYMSTGKWGLGATGEVTNNVMTIASYIQFTNIAMNRSETSAIAYWEQATDPYYNLNTTIIGWENNTEPITSCFMYATFMHEFGVEKFLEVVRSNYVNSTYNGIEIPAYTSDKSRYDDMANRMCVIFEKDLTMYMKDVLKWELSDEVIQKIKSYGYDEYIPVQNLYACGVEGVETGRPFFIPANDSYCFDFEKYTKTPGEIVQIDVSTPKYGTMEKLDDGTYLYKPNFEEMDNEYDEFNLTITVKQNNVTNVRVLPVKIGLNYQLSKVEKYAITQSNLDLAISEAEQTEPYSTVYSSSVNYTADNGINFSKATGYIQVEEDGEYEFQAYGDDKIKFILEAEENEYSSATSTYTANVATAYANASCTHFTVSLKAGETYAYTLYCYNGGGAGNGNVAYRKVGDESFINLPKPYLRKDCYGKETDKTMIQPKEEELNYSRPLKLIKDKKKLDLTNAEVIAYPNKQPGDGNDIESIVDGNYSTFFHSAYSSTTITPFPHEYILDLKEEREYNEINIYTRSSNTNGTIGDYEIYISDDNENWTKIAEDNERKGNSAKGATISVTLDKSVRGRYLKIVAKNNKNGNNFTIISEVELCEQASNNKQIAQNSSKINYEGDWVKKVDGVYVNGATYASIDGTFKYAIQGTSTMIYSTTDAKVQIKINDGEWIDYDAKGSKTEPAVIIRDLENKTNHIQVKVVEGELSLNLLATDGIFKTYEEDDPDPYPIPEEPWITSEVYKIEEYYVAKIKQGTTFAEFKENVETNCELVLEDKEENILGDDDIIATNMKLKVGDSLIYTLIVTGDINGDGQISITDLVRVKLYTIKKLIPNEIEAIAADMNEDEEISITDVVRINLTILRIIK